MRPLDYTAQNAVVDTPAPAGGMSIFGIDILWIVGGIAVIVILIMLLGMSKKNKGMETFSSTKERWEERVDLTAAMTPGTALNLYLAGKQGRQDFIPKRLGWTFGPLYDKDYVYLGFTKGFFPLDRFPIKAIAVKFRRPLKLGGHWFVKPYLIQCKREDISSPGPAMMIYADGWNTWCSDLYLVPNASKISSEEAASSLQADGILKAHRAVCDNFREREDTLAKASKDYFQYVWGKRTSIPIQQAPQDSGAGYMPPQTPPGQ